MRVKYSETEGDHDKKSEVGCTYRGKPNAIILFQKGINHLPQKHTTAKTIIPHRAENTNTKKNMALTSMRKAVALT